jgi:hypothetical protein
MYLELAKLCWNPSTKVMTKTITRLSGRQEVSAVQTCGNETDALKFAERYFSKYWGPGEVTVVKKRRRVRFLFVPEQDFLLVSSKGSANQPSMR